MSNTYIKPEERKTILFIGDDLRAPSGVGVMSRAIVYRTAEHFNWVQIGVLTRHDRMDVVDISDDVNQEMGYKDAKVYIIPDLIHNHQYSCIENVRAAIRIYKPAAIVFFTDPRYYEWIFKHEIELRQYCPLIYLNIWDNLPYPLWNIPFYQACDGLLAISKQTHNINIQLVQDEIDRKILKYVPHGIENTYYPMSPDAPQIVNFKKEVFGNEDPKFILLFNARNMGRKNIADLILGWKLFTDSIPFSDANKCCLLLHCAPSDWNGTDLMAVWRGNCNTDRCRIKFVEGNISFEKMNAMYNLSDGVILPSYAEGWGLSITEAMMTGKMFIATVTGGMQDQMRFEDENGQWINFSQDFPSNHCGKYTKHGQWCIPIWPQVGHVTGSPKTPYIYEDYVKIQDIAKAIKELYDLGPEERRRRGLAGYEWATGDEAGFTAAMMGERMVEGIDETIAKFVPQPNYRLSEVKDNNLSKINENIIWVN